MVSLTPNGRVNSQGTLQSALEKDAALRSIDSDDKLKDADIPSKVEDQPSKTDNAEDIAKDGKLIAEEETAVGHVGWPARECYPVSQYPKSLMPQAL